MAGNAKRTKRAREMPAKHAEKNRLGEHVLRDIESETQRMVKTSITQTSLGSPMEKLSPSDE